MHICASLLGCFFEDFGIEMGGFSSQHPIYINRVYFEQMLILDISKLGVFLLFLFLFCFLYKIGILMGKWGHKN